MNKKNVLVVVLSVVIVLLIGSILKQTIIDIPAMLKVVENKCNDENLEQEFKLKKEYAISNTQGDCSGNGVCFVEIEFLDSKNMIFNTGGKNYLIEYTKGTYEVVDNKLIYTRKYTLGDSGSIDSPNWKKIDATSSWIYPDVKEIYTVFELNKLENTIKLEYYAADNVNIILK